VHDAIVANKLAAAAAIDEVKYKKGQRYLTVVCEQVTAGWCGPPRAEQGDRRRVLQRPWRRPRADLQFVTADGAEWIRDVVTESAPDAIVCLDTFHVISWVNDALDEVRRGE